LGSNLKFEDLSFIQRASGIAIKAGNEELAFMKGIGALGASDFTQINLGSLNSRVQADIAALS
jgi:hypothetical protein